MKKNLLYLLLLLMTTAVSGQASRVAIRASALYKPEMRIFYAGISNPFSCRADSIAPEQMTVITDYGSLLGTAGEYSISFPAEEPAQERSVTLRFVTTDTAGRMIMIDSAQFRVLPIPSPEAIIKSHSGSTINKEVLAAADSLVVIMRNCYLKQRCTILSFSLTYYEDYFFNKFEQPEGCRFTALQKSAIMHMPIGTKLKFEHIRVLCPDGIIRTITPLALEISL